MCNNAEIKLHKSRFLHDHNSCTTIDFGTNTLRSYQSLWRKKECVLRFRRTITRVVQLQAVCVTSRILRITEKHQYTLHILTPTPTENNDQLVRRYLAKLNVQHLHARMEAGAITIQVSQLGCQKVIAPYSESQAYICSDISVVRMQKLRAYILQQKYFRMLICRVLDQTAARMFCARSQLRKALVGFTMLQVEKGCTTEGVRLDQISAGLQCVRNKLSRVDFLIFVSIIALSVSRHFCELRTSAVC